MRLRLWCLLILIAALAATLGCGNKPSEEQQSTSENQGKSPSLMQRMTGASKATLPQGTLITVRLGETISTKSAKAGDSFTGTVAEPVSEGGKVVIPAGSSAEGTVADSKGMGHFKGGALLKIVLTSITVNGNNYQVQTSANSHFAKGKGKRSAVMIGGGAGLGALIGGLAGGGKGAAIGAGAGAGAGTAGAAFTGNKDIVLPAESAVSFKLLQPVEIKM